MSTAHPAPASFLRRHEEGVLYVVAAAVYITLGVFLKSLVLNWVVGPLFPFLVVYLIPKWVRGGREVGS